MLALQMYKREKAKHQNSGHMGFHHPQLGYVAHGLVQQPQICLVLSPRPQMPISLTQFQQHHLRMAQLAAEAEAAHIAEIKKAIKISNYVQQQKKEKQLRLQDSPTVRTTTITINWIRK